MKKFLTFLVLVCLTVTGAWATDIENVAFKNDASMYLNAAVSNDVVNVGTTAQNFSIKAVSGEDKAYQLYNNDISRWINSGSNGYLSSAEAQTNARYFYFYQVSAASNAMINATPVATPEVGKKYVIVVKNTNSGYEGYYAVYGQLANGKTNRLDAIKLSDSLPGTLMITGKTSSTGDFDYTKMVWSIEQLSAPEPPVDVTKTYYLYDKGISQYVVMPSATGSSANVTPSTTDKTAVKFAAVTGGYSIQDATTGNYIGIDSWNAVSTTTAQPWAIAKVEGGITIKNTSGDYAGKYFGGQSGKTKFYNNNPDAIVFSLEEAAPATKECPQCSEAVDIDATECPKCGYVFESEPSIEFLAMFDFDGTSLTTGATSADFSDATSGVTVTVATSSTNGLGSGTSSYSLTDAQITDLNTNVNSTSAFTNTAAQTYITAGAKAATADLTITISGLTANKPYNVSLVTGLDFEGAGSWNKITSSNACERSTPELGAEQIQVRALTPYVITSMVANSEGKIVLVVDDNNGSHTAVINALAIAKVPVVAQTYTVSVTGNADGKLIYNGNEYGNNDTFDAEGLSATMLSAKAIAGYTSEVALSGTTVTVTYTAISYTFETSPAPVSGEWQNGTKFYTIKEKRAGYLCASQLPNIKSQTAAPTTDDGKWAVIANGSYFQFMNKDTQEVLTFASTDNDALASTTDDLTDANSIFDVVTYKNSKFEAGYECFTIAGAEAYPNDKGVGLAIWNNAQALWGWGYSASNPGSGDDGSKFIFTKVEELTDVTYTVSVVGAPTGATVTVTVKGETVVNNSVSLSSTASESDVVATDIEGYTYSVSIADNVITVTYEEAIPSAGTVYTIKAWFSNANPVYLTNAGGTTLTFPESAQGAKSYWVARESNGTYAWKLQSGYGDGRYLDGNVSSGGISATGFEIDIEEIAGTSYYSLWTNLTGKGERYVGTWCASHAPGFGLYGGAFGMSHSDATWTTKYIIEPVPNVTAYNVVCAMADGGIAPAFTGYTGATNVKAGGVIVVPNDVEINTTNFPVLPVTGYEGSVSASGNTITVTYEMTSIPVDVTYTFTIDGETIGTTTITEFQGEASTVASVIPSYVEATGIPATIEQDAYTIETSYTDLPFEVGKKYYVNISNGLYWLYANSSYTCVKEATTKGTGSDYEWTVGGDWLNGFSFVNGQGYYMAAPSANPSNGNNTTVATTDGALTRFDIVQNGSYGYRFKPHGGSNYIAHTSLSSLNLGFFDYYGRDTSYNVGNMLKFVPAGVEITIGATGYATMAYAEDFVKPEGLKVYYCLDEGEAGHLSPVEWDKDYIPGYCAYILEGTPNTTYTFNEVANDFEIPAEDIAAVSEIVYDGVLIGNYSDEAITLDTAKDDFGDNIYVFSKVNDKMGFYKYAGTTLAAHKAFYATDEASVQGFIVDFNGTEGINAVMSATNLKAGYDIQGRRINSIQKGINILNGKKIIK